MTWKAALTATAIIATSSFAEEAPEMIAKVSIVEIKETRMDNDDRRWIFVDLACEGCEAVPEGQCFDVIIRSPDGRQIRTHRSALAHGFTFTAFSDEVRVELVEHEGHVLGKRPSRKHRKDGCVAGPKLTFGKPMEFDLSNDPTAVR